MAAGFGKLLGELKQRHVLRVAAVYIVVGWIIVQAAALLEPALHLPDWFDTAVDVALILGFLPAMVLAWSSNAEPTKVQESPVAAQQAPPERPAIDKPVPTAKLHAAQKIKYCKARDGTRIAYATLGEGPPLVKTAHWMTHLDFELATPHFQHWFTAAAEGHTLVRYDERGCGLSDWDVDDISQEAFVQDLETVVDEIGLDKFALLGISQGAAVSIEYAVRHPERVSCLILFGGFPCGQRRSGNAELVKQFEAWKALVSYEWGTDAPALRQYFTALMYPDATPEDIKWYNEMQRRSVSAHNAARILEAVSNMDVRDLLPRIQAPTLVIHPERDAIADFEQGRAMAAAIPNARLVTLDSRNHILLESDPTWNKCVSEVRNFLAERC